MGDRVNLERAPTTAAEHEEANGQTEEAGAGKEFVELKELASMLLHKVETLEGERSAAAQNQISLYDEVRRFETDLIRRALIRAGGNQRRAARLLGVKVTTLNTKIKRYKIPTDTVLGNFTARDEAPLRRAV